MEYLVKCSCHKCGVIGESNLSFASPHIKQSCPECGAYQKFYNVNLIPDVREIKVKIWGLVNSDLSVIESAKSEVGFVKDLTGIYAKLQYYKLYKHILACHPRQ